MPLEEWEGRMNVGMSNSVTTAIRDSIRDTAIGKTRNTERADRATVEQANVYHATKTYGQELAIKVYKTSVLVFKDRDRYVQGDYRFRHGYCKHNPRKMVKTWVEKEMRNLLRVGAAGIRCPKPLLLRLHVLVMEFIGNGGWAAPRLKDAALSDDKLRVSYFESSFGSRAASAFTINSRLMLGKGMAQQEASVEKRNFLLVTWKIWDQEEACSRPHGAKRKPPLDLVEEIKLRCMHGTGKDA
ncbi:hypothetical protein ABZP36_000711 [Zizania latifolia]